MTFRVGQKIVCVDAVMTSAWVGKNAPTEGAVYTIRQIRPSLDRVTYGRTSILVEEITNPVGPHGQECGFLANRFRPAVSPGFSFDTSIPADPDSEQYDNRRRIPVPEWGCSA